MRWAEMGGDMGCNVRKNWSSRTVMETNKNDFSMPSVIEGCVREMYANINRLDNIVNRKNITSHIPLHIEEDDSIKNKLICCSIL